MAVPQTIQEAIDRNARGPKKIQNGSESVEAQSIQDQIAADEYLAAKAAQAQPGFGIGIQVWTPIYR